jgi:hypothetical protein
MNLDVELKLTDTEYHPLAGEPIRLVFGTPDWQAPDAGVRIVTDTEGSARFTTPARIDRRWTFPNIGFTPFVRPTRGDHITVAAELAFVLPRREGADAVHHWLYVADVHRLPDGDCSTDDLDHVYAAGPDGRFTRLVGRNAAGPNFDRLIDGWQLASAGYKLWDFSLAPRPDPAGAKVGTKRWHLRLGLLRKPKPVLPPSQRP